MKTIMDLRKDLDASKTTSEELFNESNKKGHASICSNSIMAIFRAPTEVQGLDCRREQFQ